MILNYASDPMHGIPSSPLQRTIEFSPDGCDIWGRGPESLSLSFLSNSGLVVSLLLSGNPIVSPYLLVISLPINICLFLSFFVYELWVSQIARKFRLLSTNTCMWSLNWCFCASWMFMSPAAHLKRRFLRILAYVAH